VCYLHTVFSSALCGSESGIAISAPASHEAAQSVRAKPSYSDILQLLVNSALRA